MGSTVETFDAKYDREDIEDSDKDISDAADKQEAVLLYLHFLKTTGDVRDAVTTRTITRSLRHHGFEWSEGSIREVLSGYVHRTDIIEREKIPMEVTKKWTGGPFSNVYNYQFITSDDLLQRRERIERIREHANN